MKKANEFEELLRQHLLIAADLVNSAKAGNLNAATMHRKRWYDNADQIAEFLAEINPYWDNQKWRSMLYSHLEMTENEAIQYLNKQYTASIIQYEDIENEALEMADYMSLGIIKQFHI
ncbi:MAG: hypothetical protein ACOX4P_06505 [Anaerovoracaceae bacterium]|jgi:hypothetical protein